MNYRGKLIGFLVGFWLGHVVGALLGLWMGHLYDRGLQQQTRFSFARRPGREEQAIFLHTAFAVMGHIAKAAGRVSEQQIRVASQFMDRMELQGALRREAQDSFRQGKEADFPLHETLSSFRHACRGQVDLLRVFMEMQLQAAFADGALQGEQRVRLLEVAELLGFSRWELEQLLAMAEAEFSFARHGRQQGSAHGAHARQEPSRDRLQAAYTLLGGSSEATDSEVKRAYRKQMNKHHPDKLAAKGLPPEMQKMAKEKAQEIQQAWELIKQSRNLR